MSNTLNNHIYLVLPPNILRRAREVILRKFPAVQLEAPDTHAEMLAFSVRFGETPIPGLTVSAYPPVLLHGAALEKKGALGMPDPLLPPLREELAALGMTPPLSAFRVVAAVPVVMAASAALSHPLKDWIDLCAPDFPGPIGCPPADTPLPHLAEAVLRDKAGDQVETFLKKLDLDSNPIDLNKRIAAGQLAAALIIPAFARTFRAGSGRMIWPDSGAIAIPLLACLSADAAPVAHDILNWLLSDEFQHVMVSDGAIVPVVSGTPGFDELAENHWNLLWPGWDGILSAARRMCTLTS